MPNAIANWSRLAACGNSVGSRAAGPEVSRFTDCDYNDFARGNRGGLCREATMLRDTLVGLIEPMLRGAGVPCSRAGFSPCCSRHRTIDPQCLENPRPAGAESTLTEHARSPFHAEPRQACNKAVRGLAGFGRTQGNDLAFPLRRGVFDAEIQAATAQGISQPAFFVGS